MSANPAAWLIRPERRHCERAIWRTNGPNSVQMAASAWSRACVQEASRNSRSMRDWVSSVGIRAVIVNGGFIPHSRTVTHEQPTRSIRLIYLALSSCFAHFISHHSTNYPHSLPGPSRQLEGLGERVRLTRLRRQYSASMLASRAGATRSTLYRVETGDPGGSIGTFVSVLRVLRLHGDLDAVAKDDSLGRKLYDLRLPVRRVAPR